MCASHRCRKVFSPLKDAMYEHSFIMQSLLDDSKRRHKDLRIAWFDLKNAFGSIPQHRMFEMKDRLPIPRHLPPIRIQTNQSVYINSKFVPCRVFTLKKVQKVSGKPIHDEQSCQR